MKTKNILTLIMLFVICTIQAENEEPQAWGYVETLKDEWLRAIGTQGLDTVYIVGEKGLIAKSTDQGSNWQKSYFPTEVNLNAVLFLNQQTGVAAGENGTVLKTTDAGENWTQVATPTTEHINAIARAGNNSIWAVGNSSLVMYSEDNGDSWQTVNLLAKQLNLNDIAFRESMGYIVGDSAIVYKTEDNGINWENKELIENARVWEGVTSLSITENKAFMLVEGHLLYTIDSNSLITWIPTFSLPGTISFTTDNIGYHFFCAGAGEGFVIEIHQTTNTGENWAVLPIRGLERITKKQYYNDYVKMKIINNSIGYIISGTCLFKTPSPTYITLNQENVLDKKGIKLISDLNILTLLSNEQAMISIELFNSSGIQLYNKKSDRESEHHIYTESLATGIYIIKATLEDNTVVSTKWIKY